MKLYELIEEGALVAGEEHRKYLRVRNWRDWLREERYQATGVYACALGTAYVAITHEAELMAHVKSDDGRHGGKAIQRDLAHVVAAANLKVACPRCGVTGNLLAVVDHLHRAVDLSYPGHNWPRLEIVKWLKPIEDAFDWEATMEAAKEGAVK